jgi:hypothetical protein
MRRQDREISKSEAIEILQKGEFGIISMCTTDNYGYGIPLNFALKSNVIYFHSVVEGSKLEYLRKNNRVSFCVVGRTVLLPSQFATRYESTIVIGSTSEVEGEEKQEALDLLLEKYSANYMQEG